MHKLFTSYTRRCLVSRACDWVMSALSAVLLIFSFKFSLLFVHIGRKAAQRRTWLTQYRTSDVAENLGIRPTFLVRRVQHRGTDFELILTVKMETRRPVEGYFGSEFRVICNYCRVMAAWNRKTLKFVDVCGFLEKRPLMVKFSKFSSESFHRLTDRRCCVQISWN